jgi:PKD repeat protein
MADLRTILLLLDTIPSRCLAFQNAADYFGASPWGPSLPRSCPLLAFAILFSLVSLVASLTGCKEDSAVPPEDPVPSIELTLTRPSLRHVDPFACSIHASGAVMDSLRIDFGDGSGDWWPGDGRTDITVLAQHTYADAGTYTVTATAFARSKKTSKSDQIVVSDGSPAIVTMTRTFNEGDSLLVRDTSFVKDPDGDPFSVSYFSTDLRLAVIQGSGSVKLKGIDGDVNGTYDLLLTVTYTQAGQQKEIQGTVPVVINPRDDIVLTIRHTIDGKYPGQVHPELIMKAPYVSGWVKVDGQSVPVDHGTGIVRVQDLPNTPHTIEIGGFRTGELTNGIPDSTFGSKLTFPAGDRAQEMGFIGTKGTGFTREQMRLMAYYLNYGKNGGLNGVDPAEAGKLQYVIVTHDTTLENNGVFPLLGFQATETVDSLKSWLENQILQAYPASNCPKVHIQEPQEQLSFRLENGGRIYPALYSIIVSRTSGGAFGQYQPHYSPSNIHVVVSGWVDIATQGLGAAGPIAKKSIAFKELVSVLCAGNEGLASEPYNSLSCQAAYTNVPFVAPFDFFMQTLPQVIPLGSTMEEYWILN